MLAPGHLDLGWTSQLMISIYNAKKKAETNVQKERKRINGELPEVNEGRRRLDNYVTECVIRLTED